MELQKYNSFNIEFNSKNPDISADEEIAHDSRSSAVSAF